MSKPSLHDQFLLSRSNVDAPEDFDLHQLDGWHLATSPSLPIAELRTNGQPAGWLLGWPSDGTRPVREHYEVIADDEDSLYRLGGRWTAVFAGPQPRVYLDAAGSLSTVYDSTRGTVASTTTLLRWGDECTLSTSRFEQRILRPNQFYVAGLTSDPQARRLLPNHYLDLTTWDAKRHWSPPALDARTEELVEMVLQNTRDSLIAAHEIAPLVLPVTAGRDSRMLLAAAKPVISESEFVTFQYQDHRRTDASFARFLTRRYSLTHYEPAVIPVNEAQRKRYLELVGYDANEGKARDFHVAASTLPNDRVWVTGFAGEVGRAFYWRDGEATLDAEALIRRMRLDPSEEKIEAMDEWVRGLPSNLPTNAVLDLLYIEQRVGCWASPQLYGTAPFTAVLVPLASRQSFSAMLALPASYRRAQRLAPDLIRQGWPELTDLPFGRAPGVAGKLEEIRGLVATQITKARKRITRAFRG